MVPLRYNVRSMLVRKVTTLAAVIGIALVVLVFASAQMLGAGVRRALGSTGRDDTAIVLRDGSDAELSSRVEGNQLGLIRDQPQVSRTGGEPVIGEVVIVVTAEVAGGSGMSNVLVRGTPAEGIDFRPEVKIIRGRRPQPGTNEAMVGKGIADRFKGISIGQQFDLRRNRPLQIVGEFEAGGSSYESEVWGDLDVIRTSLGREGMVSSARVRLSGKDAFPAFRAALEADKTLGVTVMRESEYYRKQSEQTADFLSIMFTVIAAMFSIAAMIGAVITMNGAVAHRTREIGTLRALGFSRLSIWISFVIEALLLAVLGGVLGLAVAMLLTLKTISVINFQTFSEIVFRFAVTPGVIGWSLFFAVVMGLLGGLTPAIRASRVSPVEAMRG